MTVLFLFSALVVSSNSKASSSCSESIKRAESFNGDVTKWVFTMDYLYETYGIDWLEKEMRLVFKREIGAVPPAGKWMEGSRTVVVTREETDRKIEWVCRRLVKSFHSKRYSEINDLAESLYFWFVDKPYFPSVDRRW